MKTKKRKFIYLAFILIFIFLFSLLMLKINDSRNYKKNSLINYNNSCKQDSIFIVNKLQNYKNTLYYYKLGWYVNKICLYPNLEITAIKLFENFRNNDPVYRYLLTGNRYILFIKGKNEKKIFRDLIYFDDFKYFTIPFYKNKIKDESILGEDYYVKTKTLSKELYNLPYLRQKDSAFQNNMKQRSDIKKLEDLVNNIGITNKDNIDKRLLTQSCTNNYKSLYKIIKELFIITQMQTLNSSCLSNSIYNNPLSFNNIYEIKNLYDLKMFNLLISDTVSYNINLLCKKTVSDDFIPLREYWDLLNKRFLSEKINEIRKEIVKPNDTVSYFYSYPDLKLMKLKIIDTGNGKIKLEKDYINKEYLWMDSFFGIPINYPISY